MACLSLTTCPALVLSLPPIISSNPQNLLVIQFILLLQVRKRELPEVKAMA